MNQQQSIRKIASPLLKLPNGHLLKQQVVEIQEGVVVNYFQLTSELARTEWWSGLIQLKYDAEGLLRAYYEGKQIE